MPAFGRFQGQRIGRSAAIVLVSALVPAAAAAQSTTPDRIDAIERHIRQLEGDLQVLKRELGATRQQLRQSQRETAEARGQAQRLPPAQARLPVAPPPPTATEPSPKPAPDVAQTTGNRFGLESADGRNSIYLTGRLHFDVGDYFGYQPASSFAPAQNLHSGVNARRARLGVTGKFAEDWHYTLIYELGGSA